MTDRMILEDLVNAQKGNVGNPGEYIEILSIDKALTSLKAYYKEELMKKLESMNYKSCCCLKYMNLAIEEVLE
jgi:hypothetical protein